MTHLLLAFVPVAAVPAALAGAAWAGARLSRAAVWADTPAPSEEEER